MSCNKETDSVAGLQYAAHTESNVVYGSAALQKMDVYFPDRYNEETPVVFVIHGGAFVAGAKEDFTAQAQKFKAQGFVTVNLSYRLVDTAGLYSLPPVHRVSTVKVSDALADVDAAVRKYRELAAGWHGGTRKMYMAGHSAGAVLAMLYVQGDYNRDGYIRASGNWAGATDFSIPNDGLMAGYEPRLIELYYRMTGAMPATANNLYYMAISPYWVVTKARAARPNISILPENNTVFNTPGEAAYNLYNTQNFHALLRSYGAAEQLRVYPGEDHSFRTRAGAWDQLIAETAAFFRSH